MPLYHLPPYSPPMVPSRPMLVGMFPPLASVRWLPGVDVFQGPVSVFLLVGQHVSIERQVGRCQVERVVSHAVEVLGAMRQHLGVVRFEVDHFVFGSAGP